MNKLKNIGISALAGTLVSLSAAQAGGVSVNGVYELSYTDLNHTKVSGNKLGVKKNISFGAGGDLSDGGGVTWATNVGLTDGAALSSASLSINMGGIATLTYDSGGGGTGANAVDNIVPTAWEEVDYGLKTGITDVGAVSATKGVVNLTVKAPVAGTGFSLSYAARMGADHVSDGAVQGVGTGNKGVDLVLDFVDYDAAHFGFRWGVAGQLELPEQTCKRDQKNRVVFASYNSCAAKAHKDNPYAGTMYTKLQLGPLHLGTQATFKDPMDNTVAGIKNKRSIVTGAALVFGDTLSVSYGKAWDRYRYNNACRGGSAVTGSGNSENPDWMKCSGDNIDGSGGEYETIEYYGWSAALNLGPVALKGTKNSVGGWGENSSNSGEGLVKSHSEINLSIAF